MPSKPSHRPPTAVSGRVRPLHLALGGIGLAIVLGLGYVYFSSTPPTAPTTSAKAPVVRIGVDELQLNPEQIAELQVGAVTSAAFDMQREALGIIDFNQDQSVPVFSPYQGRIGSIAVRAGDDVAKGQLLYTVQIPDIAAAGAALISTAGTLKVTGETLRRAQSLFETQSIPQKELQQNTADQQAADAAYRAARKSLTLFGLSNATIDEIEAKRTVDTEMQVRSPFAGRITARSGAVGQLVQPGNSTAPLTVANMQSLWMIASVPESELASYRAGQAVAVKVQAYPDTNFAGKISYISDMADASTHRITVRADVADAKHLLKPQMMASFTITVGSPVTSAAIEANALAREGDGSLSAWVTQDGTRFKRRKVTTGLVKNGMVQVLTGLAPGEKIAHNKALFLSNLYLITLN